MHRWPPPRHRTTDVATLPVATPALSLRGARVRFGDRTLWDGLDLDVAPGEFVAVLGPNGSGKTTLVRVLLGLLPLSAGEVRIGGRAAAAREPDHRLRPAAEGARPGPPAARARPRRPRPGRASARASGCRGRRERRARVDAALAAVGGTGYADAPVGRLSGGEQQRLRVAQALVGDPDVLLCDEPLLSLDLAHQRTVTRLIDERRRSAGTAVLFVTHEINPVLPLVDRVLYLVDGRFRIGPPEEVMTSEVLSELYRTEVDVLRVRGRLVVVGAEEHGEHCHEETA